MCKLLVLILIQAIWCIVSTASTREVTCYYRNWMQNAKKGKAKFLPEDIDASLCSVIKYAFLRINDTTNVLEMTQKNDGEMLRKISDLKKVNPSLKVEVAIGGWNHENKARFSTMADTYRTRKIFIYSVIEFLKQYNLDGVSIDWLYPGIRPKNSPTDDKQKFSRLLKEMLEAFHADARRRKLKRRFRLSATVSSSVKKLHKSYEILNVAKYVDSVDVMVNSLWGHWKQRTGSTTAMKGKTPTVVESIEAWLDAGMPASKLNIGFALYGRSFTLKSENDYELDAPTTGPGEAGNYTRKTGILAYYEICSRKWTHSTEWYNSETEAAYASKGKLWVAYDNPLSLKYKIDRLFQRYKLRGVTLWALDYDDFTGRFCNDGKFPLTRQVKMALSKGPPPVVPTCKVSIDVGILLDSSGSLRNNFRKEKDFLKQLSRKIGIGNTGTRIGVITFSHSPEHSIKLDDYSDILAFGAAVDDIEYMGYTTRIDRALRLAQINMFTEGNGARMGIPKFLIILTDGTQTKYTDAEDPREIGEELRKSGITIFTIGIGSGINKTELVELAGSKENSFAAASFNELSSGYFVKDIGDAVCSAAAMIPVISCQHKVDLGFVLDSSGSLENNYVNEKYFLKTIASSFGISKDGTRAGVITFSYTAKNSIKMNDHYDVASFNAAVDEIPLMGYTTRIDRALRMAQTEMFTTKNGARGDVPDVLIFLTDGSQTHEDDAEHPGDVAEELRRSGVHVLIIGIGRGTNRTELQHLAGDEKRVFFAPSFKELIQTDFISTVKDTSCSVLGKPMIVGTGKPMTDTPTQPKCTTVSDIGFLLDSSGSLQDDYKTEKEFLKRIAAYFGISSQGYRAGVITFSFSPEHSIKLNDHFTLESFNKAVDDITHMGYTTRIDRALRLAQKNMFSEENGGRTGKNKVLVLLTDGTQTQDPGNEKPGDVADELRDLGISIFTVGIGAGVQKQELLKISGGHDQSFTVSSFKELLNEKLVEKLGKVVCPDDKMAPIELETCDEIIDLGFVMDSSGSLKNNYDKLKYFVKSIASSFGVSDMGTRAGVITFSYAAIQSIRLGENLNTSAFNKAMDKIPFMGYTTRIDRALDLAHKEMFQLRNGARSETRKILILLTDGSQTEVVDSKHPAIVANKIRRAGVELIVVGIGKGVNATELTYIAGNRKNVFIANDFSELVGKKFTDMVRNASCKRNNRMSTDEPHMDMPSFIRNDVETMLTKSPSTCQSVLDVGFLLDSSGSLRNDYVTEKNFLKTLSSFIGVSEGQSRVSVITFSFFAKLSIKLSDHYNVNSFTAAVDAIPLMGYTTMIDRALLLAKRKMFAVENGARYGVPKVLILMTDGTQTNHKGAEDPVHIANKIRDMGIKLFVIGIGKGVNSNELIGIAGNQKNVFTTASFSDLIGENFLAKLMDATCEVGAKTNMMMEDGVVPAKNQPAPPVNSQITEELMKENKPMYNKLICPLDRDINKMQLMMDKKERTSTIADYFHQSHILTEMMKYFHHLKLLMTFLSARIPGFETKVLKDVSNVIKDSVEGSCRAFETDSVLSRIFSEVPGDDLFTATRKNGGEYFVDLLWASGLASDILKSGEYVFIVPVDHAFKKIPKILRKRLMDPSYMKRVVQFHISKIGKNKRAVSPSTALTSLDGKTKIFYNMLNSIEVFTGAMVLKQKIRARNGIVWIVDNLMLPPQNSIFSIVRTAKHLTILNRAISDPYIKRELRALGSFTIFAPTDEAFKRYSGSKYHTIRGKYTLRSIIRGHIIPGSFFTSIFDYSVTYRLKALDNSIVFVQKIDDREVIINHGVNVQRINIHGTDGVLHIVGGVITANTRQ